MPNGQGNENNFTSRSTVNNVLLFHGPDVFDQGYAAEMIETFDGFLYYQAGTMGRTAAYDHGLDMVVTIPDMPGKVIRTSLNYDALLIVIHPKTKRSGKCFARIIVEHAESDKPIMHVDCRSKIYTVWQGVFPCYIHDRLRLLGYVSESPITLPRLVTYGDNTVTRHLQSCSEGEHVLCNNILIGTAMGEVVSITTRHNRIVSTSGVKEKPHGLEKIGEIDIATAKCCSTAVLRQDVAAPRITRNSGRGVSFINHAGADVYELAQGYEGAVVVGDDTSRIVGDILYRFSMPVIAITDGDWDRLLSHERFFPGSIVLTVDMDDEVGKEIYVRVFGGKNSTDDSFSHIREIILDVFKDRICDVRSY